MPRMPSAQGQRQREIFESVILPKFLDEEQGAPLPWKREAIIYGGQPGSGNAGLLHMARQELVQHGATWVIKEDDFFALHLSCAQWPHGRALAKRRVDADIREWAAMTLGAAQERGVNIILESNFHAVGSVAKQLKALRHGGYMIQVCVLAVKEQECWQGIFERYEQAAASGGYLRPPTEAIRRWHVYLPLSSASHVAGRVAQSRADHALGVLVLMAGLEKSL